jgi:putative flippase GtrA
VKIVIAYFKTHFWQIFRFGLVGGTTFTLYLSLTVLFFDILSLDYRVAVSISYVMTVVTHFLLNRYFTYQAGADFLGVAIYRYLMLLGLNYLNTMIITSIVVEQLKLTPYHGIIFSVLITSMTSFLIMKYYVFKKNRVLLS